MKKILFSVLVAGFVTVAAAESPDYSDNPFNCNNNPSSKCCIDVSGMMTAISQAPTHSIPVDDDELFVTYWLKF